MFVFFPSNFSVCFQAQHKHTPAYIFRVEIILWIEFWILIFITSYYKHFVLIILHNSLSHCILCGMCVQQPWEMSLHALQKESPVLVPMIMVGSEIKYVCLPPPPVIMMSCYLWHWKVALLGVRLNRWKDHVRAWSWKEKKWRMRKKTNKEAKLSVLRAWPASLKYFWPWEFCPLIRNQGNDVSAGAWHPPLPTRLRDLQGRDFKVNGKAL